MNKKDKKNLCALIFAQTSILSFLIIYSPYYWNIQVKNWEALESMAQLNNHFRKETTRMESNLKVQKLKRGFEKKGIGVEEAFNLKSK